MNVRLPEPRPYYDRDNEAATRRALEQALAAFGAQGLTFIAELETGSLDVTGNAEVSGKLIVGTTVTSQYWKARVAGNSGSFTTVDADILVGLVMVRDATNGGSALLHIDVNATNAITVISQPAGAATTFVTAAPGATQIQLQMSGNDLQVKGGASRASFNLDILHFGELAS